MMKIVRRVDPAAMKREEYGYWSAQPAAARFAAIAALGGMPPTMWSDFFELLTSLNTHHVQYLIVGGYAVGFHAQPRATKDLDLWIDPTPENAEALYAALASFGAPLAGLEPGDFLDPDGFYRIGVPPTMVDVFSQMPPVTFAEAWPTRLTVDVGHGVTATVIGRDALIQVKTLTGRPQDLADIAAMREAAEHIGIPRCEHCGGRHWPFYGCF